MQSTKRNFAQTSQIDLVTSAKSIKKTMREAGVPFLAVMLNVMATSDTSVLFIKYARLIQYMMDTDLLQTLSSPPSFSYLCLVAGLQICWHDSHCCKYFSWIKLQSAVNNSCIDFSLRKINISKYKLIFFTVPSGMICEQAAITLTTISQ